MFGEKKHCMEEVKHFLRLSLKTSQQYLQRTNSKPSKPNGLLGKTFVGNKEEYITN